MAGTVLAPQFGTWKAPERPVTIEYSGQVIDEIRMAAVDGYHLVPHGGVETGGILFGTHEGDRVRILAWRRIDCEYARGPSFVLSKKDEAALEQALQTWRDDPDLAGLEPAGWYHSHTRSEIFLSELDLEYFNRFFPQPWQVALVVRPASFAPTRAGFFFREPDVGIRADSSYCEFVVSPQLVPANAPAPPQPENPAEPENLAEPEMPPGPELAAAIPEPAAETEAPPVTRTRPVAWKLYVVALAAILAAGFAMWQLAPSRQRLSLSATEIGGQLHIAWDRGVGPIRKAVGGSLQIDDRGLHTEVKLTPEALRSGSISYARQSGDVMVRLIVQPQNGRALEEETRFVKPGIIPAAPPPPPQTDAEKQELEREAADMQARLDRQTAELARLQEMVGAMHNKPVPAPPPAKASVPIPFPTRTASVAPPKQPETPPPPVPKIESLPASGPVAILRSGAAPAAPIPPPVAPASVSPHPQAPPIPATGRVIWTGKLEKSARLVIQSSRASTGVLSGILPSMPVRVTAYPGDLTSEGIALFTPDERYAKPMTEAAGARNGWNRTTYTLNPKRAAGIRIVQQPSAENGFRLILQCEGKLSVVVMEWREER
jgi:proteasome lid subunit RPN8/RPN11